MAGRGEGSDFGVSQAVRIPVGSDIELDGDLNVPAGAGGVVVFAHGSGSGRHSPRNRYVADVLVRAGLGTVLVDLLTSDEERVDLETRELRFDIPLLAGRLVGIVDWLGDQPIGLFGASTGAAAALIAATERPSTVRAVVSRGGRPDLARDALPRVAAPTLLIVGGRDDVVLRLNREAQRQLTAATTSLEIVPGATHLFEERGALEQVAALAVDWFRRNLRTEADVRQGG